ncbi:hypothetisches protein [mine drainage metagenome]|uniref:Hypothetisches protein n=1 Tax=mine drainage metagenome TaxID=410659 RepID=A0A1J5RLH9_9ZZZZ
MFFMVKNTYTIKELQRKTAAAVREAEAGGWVSITRHDKDVAVLLGRERVRAIVETLEILGDAAAMRAIATDRDGTGKYTPLADLG